MNSRKERELVDYLKSLGFAGEKLESDIRKQINRGLLSFTVNHKVRFGEEWMHFRLRLKKDQQFDAYRLEEYMTTYRRPADIKHGIIDGIDTHQLEERMKGKDWISFLENPDKITDPALRSHMSKTLEMLNTLYEERIWREEDSRKS